MAIVRQEHPLISDEENAVPPGRKLPVVEKPWPFAAVVPRQLDRRQGAARPANS